MKIVAFILISLLSIISVLLYSKQNWQTKATLGVEQIDSREVYLGAWVGGFWDNETKTLTPEVLTQYEKMLDKKFAIATIYAEWEYLPNPELLVHLQKMNDNGWTPMVSSNPYFFASCPEGSESLYKTIASGKCDAFLRDAARNLRSYEKPVMFRFAWEMNLPDMYWSIDETKSKPEDFIVAWRHMHTIMQEEQATNVIWVLSFNTSHPKTVPYAKLYPGDAYVDWVAIDGYNWGDSHEWSGWASFSGVFTESYTELVAVSDKPLMLSEVNSAPSGGDKAQWLDDMLTTQIPYHFPRIHAIVFFDEDKNEDESVDWRLARSQEYVNVVKSGLKNEMYKSSFH